MIEPQEPPPSSKQSAIPVYVVAAFIALAFWAVMSFFSGDFEPKRDIIVVHALGDVWGTEHEKSATTLGKYSIHADLLAVKLRGKTQLTTRLYSALCGNVLTDVVPKRFPTLERRDIYRISLRVIGAKVNGVEQAIVHLPVRDGECRMDLVSDIGGMIYPVPLNDWELGFVNFDNKVRPSFTFFATKSSEINPKASKIEWLSACEAILSDPSIVETHSSAISGIKEVRLQFVFGKYLNDGMLPAHRYVNVEVSDGKCIAIGAFDEKARV